MEERLKQRLVGAAVLVGLAVIVLPMVLDDSGDQAAGISATLIPPRPEHDFQSRILPLEDGSAPSVEPEPVQVRPPGDPVPLEETPKKSTAAEAEPVASVPATPPEVRVGLSAWAVQLGSFSNPVNAVKLRDRLRGKGYTAFVETVYLDNGKKTRVFVGPELKKAQAEVNKKKLLKDVDMQGIVVHYPGG